MTTIDTQELQYITGGQTAPSAQAERNQFRLELPCTLKTDFKMQIANSGTQPFDVAMYRCGKYVRTQSFVPGGEL